MNEKNHIKKSESDFQDFVNFRKGLSPFEKKIEAAKLIYSSETTDVDKAYNKVSIRMNRKFKLYKIYVTVVSFAAVLTLPLLVFTIWSLFFQEAKEDHGKIVQNEISWQNISCPMGMRSHVVLPDGTNLWLNAGSKVRYSIPFIRNSREVEISGEVYIDVVKNAQSPFIVKAGKSKVEVIGTQLNVNAWPESDKIRVALKEGQANFQFSDVNGKSKSYKLQPNDFLEFDVNDKNLILENTNIEKYIAWHQNIMILDNTTMTELSSLLERWYGVKVVIGNEEIKRYKFTTILDNEPLHRVIELLEISSPGIEINYSIGKPIAGTKKFSPSIITITKN